MTVRLCGKSDKVSETMRCYPMRIMLQPMAGHGRCQQTRSDAALCAGGSATFQINGRSLAESEAFAIASSVASLVLESKACGTCSVAAELFAEAYTKIAIRASALAEASLQGDSSVSGEAVAIANVYASEYVSAAATAFASVRPRPASLTLSGLRDSLHVDSISILMCLCYADAGPCRRMCMFTASCTHGARCTAWNMVHSCHPMCRRLTCHSTSVSGHHAQSDRTNILFAV